MRDAVRLTRLGKPAVVFVQDKFERAARAQAKGLGMPELRIYAYPQYSLGAISSSEEEAKAVTVVNDFSRLLVQESELGK